MKTLPYWMVASLTLVGTIAVSAFAAFGADVAAPGAASPVQDILTSVLQLVALILTGVIFWAAKLLMAKFKMEISVSQEETLRKVVKDGIFYAEEWAAKKIDLEQKAATGQEKMLAAIGYVVTKIPGVNADELKPMIESVLGSLQGLGASKKVGESPAATE